MFDLEQSLDQPDPYGGSYNAADPQSLNRYSYVQNDPVNYVDPMGLNAEEIERVYTWAPRWEMNLMYWRYLTFTPDSGGGGRVDDLGGGGGGEGQPNPTPLDEAARIAEIALSANQACRDLFGANVNPVQLLRDLRSNRAGVGSIAYSDLGGVSADGTIRNANTSGNRSGVTIRIDSNPAAPFQAGYANAAGGSAFRASLSNEINNAITLIHELGHAAMGLYGNNATRITRDRGNETASIANSRLVFETCFVY